ncbi:Ig-like domain-containing protein [bacterium]|nr:Ig-like domain-containing protein [bacterium]
MAFDVIGAKYYKTVDGVLTEFNAMGASDVPTAAAIDIEFSSNVLGTSILSYAATLFRTLGDGGNETPVDVVLAPEGDNKIRVTPTDDLVESSSYTLYIPRSSHGIKSIEGESLIKGFSMSFSRVAGADETPTPVEVTDDSTELIGIIPEELYLMSSIPAGDSIMQSGLSLIAKFDGRLPSADGATTFTVETRHPLGKPVDSLWGAEANLNGEVLGSEIYISSTIDYSTLSAEQIDRLAVVGEDAITEDSIIVSDKTADSEGLLTLGFDPNTIFEVTVNVDVNEQAPTISFMGLISPFFSTLEEAKMEIGPFVQQYDDFTIALSIYRHSITAKQLYSGTIDMYNIPPRIGEYVIARTKRDILSTYFTDPSGAGAGTLGLGDLKLSGKNLVDYLSVNISALDMKIVALERLLKQGDSSSTPYTDYTHQSLPVRTTSSSAGETYGNDYSSRGFNRALDRE